MAIDPEKGLHIGTLLSCLLCIVGQAVVASLILPSLPFLVKMYFPGIDISNISYYSGYLLSAYYLGQIPGCIFWGWISDRFGRKPAMIWMNSLNVISVVTFGFSNNYWVGILARLLYGLSDGTMNVSKTMLAELANSRTISLSTSFIFVGSAIGRIIGPLCSSYLTDKKLIASLIHKFPILEKKPFLLPFLLVATIYALVVISFLLFAEDTITKEELEKARQYKKEAKDELKQLLSKESSECNEHELFLLNYHKNSSYSTLLRDKDVLLSIVIYFILTFTQMSLDSLIPSVLSNRKKYGGFEMNIKDISFVQMTTSLVALSSSLLNPIWSRLAPYRTQILICCSLMMFSLLLYPVQSLFNQAPLAVEFIVAVVFFCYFHLLRVLAFAISIVITSNVSYKEVRGTVMGLTQTVGSLGRFLGPTLLPTFYAWSSHVDHFPVHHGLAFYLLGLIIALNLIPCYALSDTCNRGKGSMVGTTKTIFNVCLTPK